MIRKITMSLMILLMLCGISSADFVYMTSAGHLGAIKISASSDIEALPLQYTGNVSSPFLASYWNGRATDIMLIDRNAAASGDRAYIFTPGNMENFTRSADIAGVYGTGIAAYADNGYSLFLGAGSTLYEVSTSSFRVLNSFDCAEIVSRDGYSTEIEALRVDSLIHVIASSGEKQKYARFDGQLKKNKDLFMSADLSAGASAMLTTSTAWPIIGHSSGIDAMRSDKKLYLTISTDYPVKAMCPDSGSDFFFSTQYYDGSNYVNTIMHSASRTEFTPMTITSSGQDFRLLRDNSHMETFAAMTDEGIRIISYADRRTFSREFTSSDLGGTLAGIAAASVSGYNANSSSSGCDSLYAGMILLAVIPFVMRRK
ncbi:MAG: hypothetical protein IKQ95_09380 [Synergistaceae bacterium]|nr:hypothetical protein [Synergistaceae bacterium]